MPNDDKDRRSFPLILYIIVPILAVMLTLAGVELILSLVFPVPYSIEWGMWYEKDPHTGYRFKPGSKGYMQNGIPADANSRGHRDDEAAIEKKEGTCRILVLGDSYTMGNNVRQEEAYPQVLEELLNAELECEVEIINAAVAGWEPFQYAQYYLHYGHRFAPDLILIGFFVGNDAFNQMSAVSESITIVMGRRVKPEDARGWLPPVKVFFYSHFNLARLFLNRGPVQKNFIREHCREFTPWFIQFQKSKLSNHLQWDALREEEAGNGVRQIGRIVESAGKQGTPVILALLPDENQVNPDLQEAVLRGEDQARYDFDMPQKMLKVLFPELGLALLIDLLPDFREDPRCLYMNDTHWTAEGHQLAAEVIAEAILPLIGSAVGQRLNVRSRREETVGYHPDRP